MAIYVGNASLAENGTINGAPGDSKQSSVPDYTGEVKIISYNSSGWVSILRPRDASKATLLAQCMITACNNPHIGYGQTGIAGVPYSSRSGVLAMGINTTVDVNADCSSLVYACVMTAYDRPLSGYPFSTSNEKSELLSYKFEDDPDKLSFTEHACTASTQVFNGDILWRSGHTGIVVSGSPRKGQVDTNIESTTVTNKFVQRKSAPKSSDKFFVNTSKNGFSPFAMKSNNGLTTPNNAAYGWGRFGEALGAVSSICQSDDPGTWYSRTEDGYTRSMAPELGSLMCFAAEEGKGFACVVENIDYDDNQNYVITTSECTDKKWQRTKRKESHGSWNFDDYIFQGFIHTGVSTETGEAESALDTFIDTATELVGCTVSTVSDITGIAKNQAWSAAFIVAVAKKAGNTLNIIIPNTFSCSEISRIGLTRNMGTWIAGPGEGGGSAKPQVGDIILIRNVAYYDNSAKRTFSKYDADSAGIVLEVKNKESAAVCVFGGLGSSTKSKKITYKFNNSTIAGYFRPNWSSVTGKTSTELQYTNIEGLYTTNVSINDAAIRHVGYLDEGTFQPSIHSSKYRLSVINYTGMLANMYSVFGSAIGTSDGTDADLSIKLKTSTTSNISTTGGTTSVTTNSACPDTGIKLITDWEGCEEKMADGRLKAYWDANGKVWTIGYGSTSYLSQSILNKVLGTGAKINGSLIITKDQATKLLHESVNQSFAPKVMAYNKIYKFNDAEKSALISFCYNCGSGNLAKLLQNGKASRAEIAEAMQGFVYSGGSYLKGLDRRRQQERDVFLKGVFKSSNAYTGIGQSKCNAIRSKYRGKVF